MRVSQSRYSQVKLVSDKRVFESFEMDARLRVSVDVEVGDIRLKRRVHLGHDGIAYPSDARPFPQFTLLLNEKHTRIKKNISDPIYSTSPTEFTVLHICLVALHFTFNNSSDSSIFCKWLKTFCIKNYIISMTRKHK